MNSKMPVYYICNMKKGEHLLVYIVASILASIVIYLFYHIVLLSIVLGFLVGIYLEKMYADSTISKRKKVLRLQFRDFLESMAVAARAGNVEVKAIKSAAKDLRLSYAETADIVKEVDNIIVQYEGGGIAIKDLFQDFADRSQLTDIQNFATIYGVIEGKSDRFGDIVVQTYEIIGEKVEIEQEIETYHGSYAFNFRWGPVGFLVYNHGRSSYSYSSITPVFNFFCNGKQIHRY